MLCSCSASYLALIGIEDNNNSPYYRGARFAQIHQSTCMFRAYSDKRSAGD